MTSSLVIGRDDNNAGDALSPTPLGLPHCTEKAIQEALQLHYERCRLFHLWEHKLASAVELANVNTETGGEVSSGIPTTSLMMDARWLAHLQELVLSPLQEVNVHLRQLQQRVREAMESAKKENKENNKNGKMTDTTTPSHRTDDKDDDDDHHHHSDEEAKEEGRKQQEGGEQAQPKGGVKRSASSSFRNLPGFEKGLFFVQWVDDIQKTERQHFEYLTRLGELLAKHISDSFLRGDECEACLYRAKYEWKVYQKEIRAAWEAEKRANFLKEIQQKAAELYGGHGEGGGGGCGCRHSASSGSVAPAASPTSASMAATTRSSSDGATDVSVMAVPESSDALPPAHPPTVEEEQQTQQQLSKGAHVETQEDKEEEVSSLSKKEGKEEKEEERGVGNASPKLPAALSRPLFPRERRCPHLSVHDLHSCTAYRVLQRWRTPFYASTTGGLLKHNNNDNNNKSFSSPLQREKEEQWLAEEVAERERRKQALASNPWEQRLRCVECVEVQHHPRCPTVGVCAGREAEDEEEENARKAWNAYGWSKDQPHTSDPAALRSSSSSPSVNAREELALPLPLPPSCPPSSSSSPTSTEKERKWEERSPKEILDHFPSISISLPRDERPLYPIGEEQEGEAEDRAWACEASRRRSKWHMEGKPAQVRRHLKEVQERQRRELGMTEDSVRKHQHHFNDGGRGNVDEYGMSLSSSDEDRWSEEEGNEDEDETKKKKRAGVGVGAGGGGSRHHYHNHRSNPYPRAMATFHAGVVRHRCMEASTVMNPILTCIQSTVSEVMELVEELQCQLYD